MEPVHKRTKTNQFDSDDDAEVYLESLLHGNPSLPLNVWIEILSLNSELTIRDIQRMCRINSLFKKMCDSSSLWNRIFQRQYGVGALDRAKSLVPVELQPRASSLNPALVRLITWRIMEAEFEGDGRVAFNLRSVKYGVVVFSETREGMSIAMGRMPDNTITSRHFQIIVEMERLLHLKPGPFRNVAIKLRGYGRSTRLFVNWVRNGPLAGGDAVEIVFPVVYLLLYNGYTQNLENYVNEHICSVCSLPAENVCIKCEQKVYCNQNCADRDWDKHSEICGKIN